MRLMLLLYLLLVLTACQPLRARVSSQETQQPTQFPRALSDVIPVPTSPLVPPSATAASEDKQATPTPEITLTPAAEVPAGTASAGSLFRWQAPQPCNFLQVAENAITVGNCASSPYPLSGPLADQLRQQVHEWGHLYASAEMETAVGKVSLQGSGEQPLLPEIARQMAEWAKFHWEIVISGRAGAAWGVVFAFTREGGFAGFCDSLTVYIDGRVLFSRCGQEANYQLSSEQLQQMYQWVDNFTGTEFHHVDPPNVADGMKIHWYFSGRGTQAVDQATQQAMREFLEQLLAQFYQQP